VSQSAPVAKVEAKGADKYRALSRLAFTGEDGKRAEAASGDVVSIPDACAVGLLEAGAIEVAK